MEKKFLKQINEKKEKRKNKQKGKNQKKNYVLKIDHTLIKKTIQLMPWRSL